jgi:hypothetical protein
MIYNIELKRWGDQWEASLDSFIFILIPGTRDQGSQEQGITAMGTLTHGLSIS